MTPKVSVVMCTYNTKQYIAEAIESVLAQTFRDFEFIIWDDGSTDGTKAIVDSYKDERIRYFYHENTGLGMALKLACAEAKGKYIARMDSDDVSLPERFAKEVEFLEQHKDYVLVSSAVYNIDEHGTVLGRSFPCPDDRVLKGLLAKASNMISHPMSMMRRDAYEKAGGYIPIRKSQDTLFWSRLAKHGKFYNISQPLGKYRLLETSLDHVVNPYSQIIKSFLRKMILDKDVLDSDVDEYNKLYHYSKQFILKEKRGPVLYKKSPEEVVYNVISIVLGFRFAERMIIGFKICFYRYKLNN